MKWVKQGKYNLTPEELNKEEERIKKKFDYLYNLLLPYNSIMKIQKTTRQDLKFML